jgi:hypothetical protein
MAMKFPRRMSNIAKAAFGTMQALKGFFSRLGKASETRLQRLSDQLKNITDRLKASGQEEPRAIIRQVDELKEESDEFYAIKNFVEKMPPGLSPPQYFNLVLELLRKLGRAEEAMDPHGLYTFKYIAKTKGKYYDVFPVIMVTSGHSVYFKGFNFHWERAPEYVESVNRTYLYSGLQSKFYRIKPHELEYFLQIPTFLPIFIPA